MTDYKISPDIFLRLSKAALQPNEQHEKYGTVIRGVRIESEDGVSIAVASNGAVLVAECLLESGEDGRVTITIEPQMIALAEAEAAASGMIVITQNPGWTVARGLETGKMYPLNAEIVGTWPDWRGLIPKELPSKNTGSFMLGTDHLLRLAQSSPSGVIVLPKFADKDAPIIIRDKHDPDWFGLVFIDNGGRNDFPKHAEIPDWIK